MPALLAYTEWHMPTQMRGWIYLALIPNALVTKGMVLAVSNNLGMRITAYLPLWQAELERSLGSGVG
jgi:hypothetical protein